MSRATRPRPKRHQHIAAEIDALLDLSGQALRHQHRRLVVHDVEDRGAVGPRLLGDFVDAAETFGDQEAGLDALALKQRVGADRGAVAEVTDVGRAHALRNERLNALQYRPRRVVRGRGDFADGNRAGILVEIDEIRERPTRIDRNPVARHSSVSLKREFNRTSIRKAPLSRGMIDFIYGLLMLSYPHRQCGPGISRHE